MKILVTGASGFIGSYIVQACVERGYDTWAAMRSSSSRRYLTDERIHFIELNLDSQSELQEQLRGHQFDYVIHAAGVTKCVDHNDFFRVNRDGTKHLVLALRELAMPLKQFVYVSSLSIFGAIREEQPYEPIRESDTPQPNTDYGRSKLEAEQWLDTFAAEEKAQGREFSYVVLRPTGVYGPRERDYFLMAQSIKQHSDFSVGYKQQDITFVYVSDVVDAALLACERGKSGGKYFLSDGEVYQSSTFSDLLIKEMGNPWCMRITAPVWVLRVVTFFGEHWGRLTGHISALNNDKYNILKQRNWRCDIEPARRELGYEPKVKLAEGVHLAVEWYKQNGWL